jgi:hypothetical protein
VKSTVYKNGDVDGSPAKSTVYKNGDVGNLQHGDVLGKKLAMRSNRGRGVPSYSINIRAPDGLVLLNISSTDTTPRRTQHGLLSESEFEMCGEVGDVGRGDVGA